MFSFKGLAGVGCACLLFGAVSFGSPAAARSDEGLTVKPAIYRVEKSFDEEGTATLSDTSLQAELVRWHGGWGGGWHRGFGWGGGFRGYGYRPYGWGGGFRGYGFYRPFYRPYVYRPFIYGGYGGFGYGGYGGYGYGYPVAYGGFGYPYGGYGGGYGYGYPYYGSSPYASFGIGLGYW